jgi:threonine/homoserine/homoserine lactone efflux protein
MPSAELLIPFFAAAALFACVPGPGMLYAAAQTLAAGRRAGWRSAAGFFLAGLWHVALAAFGVAALLEVVPALFTVMKLVGAGYLVWLGLRHLLGACRPAGPPATARPAPGDPSAPPPAAPPPAAPKTARRALRDGFVVEALNPKTALFCLAFLPQFADPAAAFPVWLQILILGAIVNLLFSLTDVVLIELSHALASRLARSDRLLLWMRRAGGGALVGLGVNLALARDP